jgi:hypothetical protein
VLDADATAPALCDLFAGRGRPTFATLRTICRALELPLQAAITFSPSASAPLPVSDVETEVSRLG